MSIKNEDKLLRTQVREALDWETSIHSADIGVRASDGVVTLTGHVPSYAQKREAETVALRVKGVSGIANDIDVRLPKEKERTDTDIAKAAVRTLKWHSELPEETITVKVRDGWVTLEGRVEWNYQRERAANAIRHLTGVLGITNALLIAPQVTPDDVRRRIKKALEREVDREADQMEIEIDGTTIHLRGIVHSWVERRQVERAAWSAPGIIDVQNHLTVEGRRAIA